MAVPHPLPVIAHDPDLCLRLPFKKNPLSKRPTWSATSPGSSPTAKHHKHDTPPTPKAVRHCSHSGNRRPNRIAACIDFRHHFLGFSRNKYKLHFLDRHIAIKVRKFLDALQHLFGFKLTSNSTPPRFYVSEFGSILSSMTMVPSEKSSTENS